MDPRLASMMAQNLKKQQGKQPAEDVVEASGGVQPGQKAQPKRKPPPGAQQIGMQAMLLQEATRQQVKLKPVKK